MSIVSLIKPNTFNLNQLNQADIYITAGSGLLTALTSGTATNLNLTLANLSTAYTQKTNNLVTTSNVTYYVADRPGSYIASFSVNFGANNGVDAGLCDCLIVKNDVENSISPYVAENQIPFTEPGAGIKQICSCSCMVYMNTGDSLQFSMYQNSGGNITPEFAHVGVSYIN